MWLSCFDIRPRVGSGYQQNGQKQLSRKYGFSVVHYTDAVQRRSDKHRPMTSITAHNRTNTARPQRRRGGWLVPVGLILLSLIPVLGGAFRLSELSGNPVATPDNARFQVAPLPVVAHIVGASVYCLLGAFQFVPSLRGRRSWHRIAGLILIPTGLVAALSGVWMAIFLTSALSPGDALLVGLRMAFGSAMAVCIILGILAIRRRDFNRHGAWMTRAYAIGSAAGTQAIVYAFWTLGVGDADELTEAVLMGTAWAINAAVAELVIHLRSRRSGTMQRSNRAARA